MPLLWLLRIWLLLLASTALGRAQTPPRCVVCQSFINGRYFWYESPGELLRQPVCESCSRLEAVCDQCRLPIRAPSRRLPDGRWLCERDFSVAILSLAEALRIYEEVWRDLQRILAGSGTLPRGNTKVALVNAAELKRLNQSGAAPEEDQTVLGLTHTRIYAGHQFQHQIYLLSGLSRPRLAAVAAHEYAHTWIHENVSTARSLDRDTTEGFCELIAYKLMAAWREEAMKRIILTNAYTRGQVNALVQAEAQHQFHRVVTWVKTGRDELIASTNVVETLALRPSDELVAPVWPPPAAVATAVPGVLLLRGISGAPARRFALINDCTLSRDEARRVRVGTSNVIVHCLDVREHSALIRIQGCAATEELFLGGR